MCQRELCWYLGEVQSKQSEQGEQRLAAPLGYFRNSQQVRELEDNERGAEEGDLTSHCEVFGFLSEMESY